MSRTSLIRFVVVAGLVVVVAGVVWLLGRPSSMSPRDVRATRGTIASLRAEGAQLNEIVRQGRGLRRTTTVRAEELATALDEEAATLGPAEVPAAQQRAVDRSVRQAQRASERLRTLAAHPSTPARGL